MVLAVSAVAAPAGQAPILRSGIDITTLDRTVRPQDDLFRYANGAWLARTEMPADRASYDAFQEIGFQVEHDLRDIIKAIAGAPDRWGPQGRQIADLYDSILDEQRIEAAGLTPALAQLTRITAIASRSELAKEAGHLSATGGGGPFDAEVGDDPQQPGAIGVRVLQGGTLLPTPAHYFEHTPRNIEVRAGYEAYLTTLFTLAGRPSPSTDARSLLAFETALATAQVTTMMDRRFRLPQLADEMPGFDWVAWARPQGIDRAGIIILAQPAFFKSFAATVAATPLETLKLWLTARYLTQVAPFLSQAFGSARFEFFGRLLTGQQVPTERWRRGVSLVNGYLGDALGRLYVEKHFQAESKRRVQTLVDTVVRAYGQAIATSAWLSPEAKAEARRKLDRLRVRIGYPDAWRSYRGYDVRRGDLLGNIDRGRRFDASFRMTVSRGLADARYWMLTPQTPNASYTAAANEMLVPAAMLQPPFFDVRAEDAVNYGAVGAIIAHEIVTRSTIAAGSSMPADASATGGSRPTVPNTRGARTCSSSSSTATSRPRARALTAREHRARTSAICLDWRLRTPPITSRSAGARPRSLTTSPAINGSSSAGRGRGARRSGRTTCASGSRPCPTPLPNTASTASSDTFRRSTTRFT